MYVYLCKTKSYRRDVNLSNMPFRSRIGASFKSSLLISLALTIATGSLVFALYSALRFYPRNYSLSLLSAGTEAKFGHESALVHAPSQNMSITIRPVRRGEADLDAIVDVVIQAFDHDPQWQWRYRYRKEYPEDHYKFTRLFYSEYMEMTFAGHNTIMLAESPSDEDPNMMKVVAMSIWDNYGSAPPDPSLHGGKPPANHPERKDASAVRMAEYSRRSAKARTELFVSRYGERQLSLRQMATLPAYWKRGAATRLCMWGMDEARKVGVAVPMFASPMGKLVYERLGFKKIGEWTAHVEGEEESVTLSALTWEPSWEKEPVELL